jgi:hypothetical protein
MPSGFLLRCETLNRGRKQYRCAYVTAAQNQDLYRHLATMHPCNDIFISATPKTWYERSASYMLIVLHIESIKKIEIVDL